VGLHKAPFGVQHCPFGSQTCPELQPQLIVPPHPLDTEPHAVPLHAAGEQQFPVGSQTCPEPQPQLIIPPHPLDTEPHAIPLHATGEQQFPVGSHTSGAPQFGGQEIIWLHPLFTDTLHRPPHGFGFGEQQVPASTSQIPPLAQSPLLPQFTG
jgi:hypothetical protein